MALFKRDIFYIFGGIFLPRDMGFAKLLQVK
jgi:hypothetical protein